MNLGLNQNRLAEATGIPQENISRIEGGKFEDIRLSCFVIPMRTLGVSANCFLGLKEHEDHWRR
jgi:predicted transcriptional regulator